MSRLCLVRHTTPVVDPGRPAEEWEVDEEGRQQAEALVEQIAAASPTVIASSPERKAVVTAEIIAQGLGLELRIAPDLREQGLEPIPWFEDRELFEAKVREHFQRSEAVVLGNESSRAAARRFNAVVRTFGPEEVPVLVSHGRIISAWLASQIALDAFEIWQNLRMPDALQVDVE